ncbi:hypothetical protein BCR44DRAFT_1478980 [Catenaria anguillulae PL171]|uniref:RmlD-like substrate binding domain-containing protein n=1 Tax=Catenaria anguillulae PL171 TaxID=765915 RepID=A0A1Y2I072_9FUNG|nr:hypothetical protein BCR44DRAFT_1478980 [Catenaria anguillulae PL171]
MVTGATGLLGRAVLAEFNSRNVFDAYGTAFSRASGDIVKLDLTDFAAVTAFVEKNRPNAIIHCAAERRPDVAETNKDATLKLNVETTRHLAQLCKSRNAFFTYISTDYVFDGRKPDPLAQYDVNDTPNPLNAYGESKWAGEQAVRSVFDGDEASKYAIVRIPVLYGDCDKNSDSAVNILLDVLEAAQKPGAPKAKVDNVGLRYPTCTGDVARVLADIAMLALVGDGQGVPYPIRGVYHFSSEERFTKYQMIELFAKLQGLSMNNVEPVNVLPPNPTANRPGHVKLSTQCLVPLAVDWRARSFAGYWEKKLGKK